MSEQEHPYAPLLLTFLLYALTFLVGYFLVAPAILPSGRTDVGRSTGHAVVEQHDTSWVTTDPSWNPVVDPDGCGCVPLPEAATP